MKKIKKTIEGLFDVPFKNNKGIYIAIALMSVFAFGVFFFDKVMLELIPRLIPNWIRKWIPLVIYILLGGVGYFLITEKTYAKKVSNAAEKRERMIEFFAGEIEDIEIRIESESREKDIVIAYLQRGISILQDDLELDDNWLKEYDEIVRPFLMSKNHH